MIVLTGPSASGKTAACLYLQAHYNIKKVVTHTTRAVRAGEKDGIDYHFVTCEQFMKMKEAGEFIETVSYNGNYYGTSKAEVRIDKCMAVELEGAKTYRSLDDPMIVLFYMKVDEEIRFERMHARGDDEDKIISRIENDREVFRLDDEMMRLIDVVVDTEHHDVKSVSDFIYKNYIRILDERGIRLEDENRPR